MKARDRSLSAWHGLAVMVALSAAPGLVAAQSSSGRCADGRCTRPTLTELLHDIGTRLPGDTSLTRIAVSNDGVTMQGLSSGAARLIPLLQHSEVIESPEIQGAITPDAARKKEMFVIAAKNDRALIIAAVSMPDGHWQLSTIQTVSEDSTPRRHFVNTLPPDKYTDMFTAADAPDEWRPEPGRLRRYTSRRPGFVAGTLESTAVAYFYTGTRWVHLWLSD